MMSLWGPLADPILGDGTPTTMNYWVPSEWVPLPPVTVPHFTLSTLITTGKDSLLVTSSLTPSQAAAQVATAAAAAAKDKTLQPTGRRDESQTVNPRNRETHLILLLRGWLRDNGYDATGWTDADLVRTLKSHFSVAEDARGLAAHAKRRDSHLAL